MVLNKIAVAALMADMVTSFTGLFSVSQYVDYVILGCWFYVAAMAAVSVAVKMTRHREELVFRLYILVPGVTTTGTKGQRGPGPGWSSTPASPCAPCGA